MNNRAYVPVRKGEQNEWYQWEHVSVCREHVADLLKSEEQRYGRVMSNWPLLRIALVEVREVQEA
jgi:hypothetical protein